MEFEIDVSGGDILSKDYVICIADNTKLIKGFKIGASLVRILNSRYGQGLYKYPKSKKGRALFKIRLYSIIIYCIFKSLKPKGDIAIKICRDFYGRESDIKSNLSYFLGDVLGLGYRISFMKLEKNSNAHTYAYLMKKDRKNKLKTYVSISLENIEQFLIK